MAKESGSEFGHEFFPCIAVIAETPCAEITIKAVLGLRPVSQLMKAGRVIALLVVEGCKGRKLHHVAGWRIKRTVAAVVDGCARAGDERVRVLDALRQGQGIFRLCVVRSEE